MAVLRPLKLVIVNYPEGQMEEVEAIDNPEDPESSTRLLPFSRELYVERDDFTEDPPRKWFRLGLGREVRLKHAYLVTCVDLVKDQETGEILELHCTYDPETRGGGSPDGRVVKGTLHWVSAAHAVDAEVRLYDQLFTRAEPMGGDGDYLSCLNPSSLEVVTGCKVEPGLAGAEPGCAYQFLRLGYFCVDPDSTPDRPVFNRIVTLRDTWARMQKAE
jgi:glutaminyl-tRNA synthetase